MSERACLYLRVSTDEQRNTNLSIANQLGQCKGYALRKGYDLYDTGRYVDDLGQDASEGTPCFAEDGSMRNGVGRTTPALLELVAAARSRSFDVMIALDVTRVSRGEPALLGAFQTQLKEYGVRLEFATSTTGDRRTDVVMTQAHALASFFENDDRARRTRQGKRQSAELRQRHTGPAPFGYRNQDKQIAPDPDTAPIARSIFESCLRGSSLRAIARDLTAASVPTVRGEKRGNVAWSPQTIGRILRNPAYRGAYTFGVHQRVDGKIVNADRAGWVEVACPALVTPEEWDAVQRRLTESAESVRNHPTTRLYPLRGRISCGECGRKYTGQYNGRDKRREYRHRIRDGGCSHRSIGADALEGRALAAVQAVLLKPAVLRATYKRAVAEHKGQFGHLDDLLATARLERDKQTRKLDKLTASYLDPDLGIAKGKYITLKDEIGRRIAALDSQIADLERQRGRTNLPPDLKTLEAWAAELRANLRAKRELTLPASYGVTDDGVPAKGDEPKFPLERREAIFAAVGLKCVIAEGKTTFWLICDSAVQSATSR